MTLPITISQLRGALKGLGFARQLTGLGFDFEPSIGLTAKAIDKLGLDISSFQEPLAESVKVVIIPSIRKNFDQGGRPEPWEPLAEYTRQRRGFESFSSILVRSGKLRKAATSFGIWTITTTVARVDSLPSNVWYGNLHQAGYGGFGGFVKAAQKELGEGASLRDVTTLAFELMDESRGGVGTKRKPGRQQARRASIPARPFILFQDEDIPKIQAVFWEWLGRKVEDAESTGTREY